MGRRVGQGRPTYKDGDGAWMVLAILLLAGFGLRVWSLGDQALWVDEASTVLGARNSLPDLTPYSLKDTFPPLHFMLLHLSMVVAGESEFATRFLSLVFGVLLLPAVWLIGRRVGGDRAGLLAAAIVAVSPYHVYFSQEVRGYTQLAALTALSIALWYRLTDRPTWRVAAGYAVVTAAAIHTQYLALGPIAVCWVAWLIQRRWRSALLGAGGTMLLLAPWVVLTILAALGSDTGSPTAGIGNSPVAQLAMIFRAGSIEVGRLPLAETIRMTIVALALGELVPVGPFLAAGLICWAVAVFGGWRRWLLLAVVLVPVTFAVLTALPTNRPHWPKYFIASAPALAVLIALGIDRLLAFRLPGRLLAAVPLLALAAGAIVGLVNNVDPAYARSDFRPDLALLRRVSPPTDVYIANPKEAFADLWYYYPEGLRWVRPPANDADLAAALQGATGVWTIQNQPVDFDADGRIARWLGQNGYPTLQRDPANMTFRYTSLGSVPVVARSPAGSRIGPLDVAATVGVRRLRARDLIHLDLDWRGTPPAGLSVYAALLDDEGRVWAQRDVPAEGDVLPAKIGILLPPGMPAGRYRVDVALYSADGVRLLATGGDRISVGPIDLSPPAATLLDWDGDPSRSVQVPGATILAATVPGGTALAGDRRQLTIDWIGTGSPVEVGFGWSPRLAGERVPRATTRPAALPAATGLRRTLIWWTVPAPVDAPRDGQIQVQLAGMAIGTITVISRDHRIESPASPAIDLGDGIGLAGVEARPGTCSGGSCPIDLTLIWSASRMPEGHYKSFVHLLDASGQIVAQRDSIPLSGAAPTGGWYANERIDDSQPGLAAPPGEYRIAVGMYDPDSGRRLVAPDGQDVHIVATVRLGGGDGR